MAYAKSYLDVPGQITLLESRGMMIPDRERAAACLNRIGYYRLSGYWYSFRQPNSQGGRLDEFQAGTHFDNIIALYVFDKNLRMHLLDAIERIEIAFRARVCQAFGACGTWAHRDPLCLDGKFARDRNATTLKTEHDIWLEKIDGEFTRSKEEFVKHFKTKYPGEFPPTWIACEVWDFGALSYIIAGMRNPDRTWLASLFGLPAPQILTSWARHLNVARNICAHHSRLWNRPGTVQPRWPSAAAAPDIGHIENDIKALTRVYGTLVLAAYLLRSIYPSSDWAHRIRDLAHTFPAGPGVSLSAAGFPASWAAQSIWT